MMLSKVLEHLHKVDDLGLYKEPDYLWVLNNSSYVERIELAKRNHIIHLGYSVITQHNKELELLYDCINREVITQVRLADSRIPAVLGTYCYFEDNRKFINCHVQGILAVKMHEENVSWDSCIGIESFLKDDAGRIRGVVDKNDIIYTSFSVVTLTGGLKKFPLTGACPVSVYVEPGIQTKYIAHKNDTIEFRRSLAEDEFRQWQEDAEDEWWSRH